MSDVTSDYEKIEKRTRIRGNIRNGIVYFFLCLWALIVLFPFYWMVLTSVKSYGSYNAEYIPKFFTLSPTLQNYVDAFTTVSLGRYLWNTLFFTVVTTAIMLVVITLAAFAFARLNFAGKDLIFTLFLSLMMIPNELVVITNFTTITNLDLRNTFTGLILPSVTSVFYIYLLRENFAQIPDELYYAAKVARRQGLDCMVVQYSQLFPHEETPQASAAKSYPGAAQDAMTQIPAGYDRYICIAKSFGTMVAAGWVKAHPEYHVTLLQLTPLAWEYAPLYAGMPAWHATGTADPLGGAALRRALEQDPAITTYFVEGGNHSLDTPEDYTIGLEALKDIVRKYEEAMR